MKLYEFQEQALAALDTSTVQRPAIVLPTGAGKTVTFSHRVKCTLERNPGKRVLILIDRDELARQSVAKLLDVDPTMDVGVVKARENGVSARVIVGSVQTLRRDNRLAQLADVCEVIVDECDLAAAPSYMKILTHLGCFNAFCSECVEAMDVLEAETGEKARPGYCPNDECAVNSPRAIGFTATLYRTDGKIGVVWQDVPFSRDISWMIRREFLIPPRGKAVRVPDLDLRTVKVTAKDYREGELGQALADSLAPELVAKAIAEHAADRKTLAFFPTVASCHVFADAINAAGIPAEVVHGGMPQAERDAVLARHKRGTVVVNCMLLTVGYDDPEVDCIVMGRPTKSKRLYVQIVGRGLRVDKARPYAEQDCLLLDVVGAGSMHDLRSMVDLSDRSLDPARAEGKTLTELEDEFDAGEGVEPDAPNFYTGPVKVEDFDPLGRPKPSKAWLKTAKGTPFLPAGTAAYVFVMQHRGQWLVVRCAKHGNLLDAGRPAVMHGHHAEQADAVLAAEDLALEMGASSLDLSNRKAKWRKGEPSRQLLEMARLAGITMPPETTAGKVSDLVTTIQGTERIDPLVARVRS